MCLVILSDLFWTGLDMCSVLKLLRLFIIKEKPPLFAMKDKAPLSSEKNDREHIDSGSQVLQLDRDD